jgi:hypothetical protein
VSRGLRRWAEPDALLALARIGIGVLFLVRTTGLTELLSLPAFPQGRFLLGWPEAGGPGLGPLLPLASWMLGAACIARTIAAALFALGVWARPAGVLAGLLGYLVVTQDPIGFNMTLHTIYLGTIVLACADSSDRFALGRRSASAASQRASLGMVRLWVASIYVWAGIAKLHRDWLSGRALGTLVEGDIVRGPVAAALLSTARQRAMAAPAIAAGEILLGAALLNRSTRRAGLAVAVVVHALFQVALAPDVLTAVMAALMVTFVGDIGPWRCVFTDAITVGDG